MLDLEEVAWLVGAFEAGYFSFEEFEDWFRLATSDVHLDGRDNLSGAVDAVEDVLSQYHFEGLRGEDLKNEMGNAILPFVQSFLYGATYAFDLRKPPQRVERISPPLEFDLSVAGW